MKRVLLLWCCISILKGTAQEKKEDGNLQFFDIEAYKDWEIDNDWISSENKFFLKKGNERIEIRFSSSKIQVERSSVVNPYLKIQVFRSSTNNLYAEGVEFYQFSIGIDKDYDETGKIINEIDNDKHYIFSLPQLIEKIKKEYHVDLEILTRGVSVDRRVDSYLEKPIYEVYLPSKENPEYETDYILIDGITGKILFQTNYANRDERALGPFEQYIQALRKKE